jgi:ParB family chromosome partitioning protein
LAAILAVTPPDMPEELRELPVELIEVNPRQPRRGFDEQSLLALSESIRSRGVLQPVLVRPLVGGRYELIAGERRWRAARLAERETIPAIIHHREDAGSLELALIENMAREDLNAVEQARGCAALVEELGLTREEVGVRVGRSRVSVSNLMRLLDLPDEALDLIERGELSEGHGRALLLAGDQDDRRQLARDAVNRRWSVRELELYARHSSRSVIRRPRRRALHPDQQAAIEQIVEALSPVLGQDIEVTAAADGGYRAHLRFDSREQALDLARALRGRLAA